MALRFISDLHLDEQRPDTSRAFFSYLDHLPADTEALYILGDFFDCFHECCWWGCWTNFNFDET